MFPVQAEGKTLSGEDFDILDLKPEVTTFRADAIRGLSGEPKSLPCKYFYDQRGSKLFEQICKLPEYYLTRTELSILQDHLPAMAEVVGPRVRLIEYGSGSGIKTRLLLAALREPVAYLPIDISRNALSEASRRIQREFPRLELRPVVSDYTRPLELPETQTPYRKSVVYFPGSTIGNFDATEARRFLRGTRRQVGVEGGLLIGLDLVKDVHILEAAYNDSEGITAAFNLNLLHRLRNELGARLELSGFSHHAPYNDAAQRIEMYLRSDRDQSIALGEQTFALAKDELIHTENCHKFTSQSALELAEDSGFRVRREWTDERRYFSVQYWDGV